MLVNSDSSCTGPGCVSLVGEVTRGRSAVRLPVCKMLGEAAGAQALFRGIARSRVSLCNSHTYSESSDSSMKAGLEFGGRGAVLGWVRYPTLVFQEEGEKPCCQQVTPRLVACLLAAFLQVPVQDFDCSLIMGRDYAVAQSLSL